MDSGKSLKYLSFLFLVCLSFVSRQAAADDNYIPGSRYTSARAAAMGDASLPLGEDGSSGLFDNPADLAKIKKPQAELNLGLSGDLGYFKLLNTSSLNSANPISLNTYQPILSASPGSIGGASGILLPNFYMKDLAVGMMFQYQTAAVVNANGTTTYHSVYELIPAVGGALRLASGIVRIGYSLQWVNVAEGAVTIPAGTSSTSMAWNNSLEQGSGFSSTAGIAITLPVDYLPSINLVGRNLLNTTYSSSTIYSFTPNSTGAPTTQMMSFDGALSFQPRLGQGAFVNFVAEYKDITNQSQQIFFAHLATGIEFSFRDQFFLRGGFGEGYPSAGFGLRKKTGEFSLTWYTEELGTTYLQQGDTRFLFQYQVRLF